MRKGGGGLGLSQNLASSYNNQLQIETQTNDRVTSKTAPARLEGFDDDSDQDENSVLIKVFYFYNRCVIRIIEPLNVYSI